MKGHSLVRDSLAVGAGAVLRKASAFVREGALAYALGAGAASDALLAALSFPALIVGLAGSAVGTVAVPLWRDVGEHRPADSLAPFNLMLLATALLVIGMELSAGVLVPLLLPGFPARQAALTTALSRVFLAGTLGLVVAAWWKAILQAEGRFAPAALSAVPVNAASAAGFLLAAHRGVGWAAAIAVFAQLLEVAWLFAVVRRHLPRWRPVTKLSPLAAAHLRGIVPAIAAALVAQADLMAARLFASGLPPGSLSSLTYGFQLASFLTGILGGSVVTAAYPRLGGGGPGRSFEIERAFGWILFVTLPATPLLLLAAPDIAAAAFLRGHFTPQALSLTTAAFRGFLLALPLRPLVGLGLRAAFARRQGGKAAIASAVSVTATVAGDLLLVPRLGVLGMAVAASAGQAVALVATISLLWEERASSRARLGGAKLIPVAVSAAPCAAAAWLLAPLGAGPLLECGVSLAALFAYLVLAHLAGVPEARSLTGAIRQRAFLRPRLGG